MRDNFNYTEDIECSAIYKKQYLSGMDKLIKKMKRQAEKKRLEYRRDIFHNPCKYREDLKKTLGWPLTFFNTDAGMPKAEFEELVCEESYTLYRMTIDIFDGLCMTGIFLKKKDKKCPLVIAQHGGEGTPELVFGIYGDTGNYNSMIQDLIEYDVHIFAPQLLLWRKEKYGVSYDRQVVDARLKRLGSSIAAVEIYGIMRIIDYFEKQDYTTTFGMIGLSYGGFYTLFTAALDERIKSAISCSWFNTRDKYDRSDWTWNCSAEKFSDSEIACLVYPRKLCLECGTQDELFDVRWAKNEMENLRKLCSEVGDDWLDCIVFEGNHEFYADKNIMKNFIDNLK